MMGLGNVSVAVFEAAAARVALRHQMSALLV